MMIPALLCFASHTLTGVMRLLFDAYILIFYAGAYPLRVFIELVLFGQRQSEWNPAAYLAANGYFHEGWMRVLLIEALTLTTVMTLLVVDFIFDRFVGSDSVVMNTCTKIENSEHRFLGVLATTLRKTLSSRIGDDPLSGYGLREDELRGNFARTQWAGAKPLSSHTHGVSAASRSHVAKMASAFASENYCNAYHIQASRAVRRAGEAGSRTSYWCKDIGIDDADDPLPVRPLGVMIDVDFYKENLASELADTPMPYLLYTTLPTVAGGFVGDASFTFSDDGSYTTHVAGGGKYSHHLWDFNPDCLLVHGLWHGIITSATAYKVEKRYVNAHQCVVFLVPLRRWTGIWSYLASALFYAQRLKRFNPVNGGYIRIDNKTSKSHTVSVNLVGCFSPITVPVEEFERARVSYLYTESKPSAFTVSRHLKGSANEVANAGLLFAYFKAGLPNVAPVTSGDLTITTYSAIPPNPHQGLGKSPCTPFMSAIDPNAYVPLSGFANNKLAATARVTDLQAKAKDNVLLSDSNSGHMKAFVKHILSGLPNNDHLIPEPLDAMRDRQTRPTQKAQIEQGVATAHLGQPATEPHIATFMKSEAYPEMKDPRVISNQSPDDKVATFGLSSALTSYVKGEETKFPWYAFKTPKIIAEGMVAAATGSSYAVCADVSRMDGSTSPVVINQILKPIYTAAFHQHLNLVVQYFERTRERKAVIGRGLDSYKYETGSSTLSGEPGTSINNTLIGAAITWLAMCFLHGTSGGTYSQVIEGLNRYLLGGDDSVGYFTQDVTPEHAADAFSSAGRALGYVVKVKVILRGDPVDFLGRYFMPWNGSQNSCADVRRQVRKLHLTASRPPHTTDEEALKRWRETKALEKAISIACTDSNTPILGEWSARTIVHVLQSRGQVRPTDNQALVELGRLEGVALSWWASFATDCQFPNELEDWMQELVVRDYPGGSFDWVSFRKALAINPLTIPCCTHTMDPVNGTAVTLAVDGEAIIEPTAAPAPLKLKTAPRTIANVKPDRKDKRRVRTDATPPPDRAPARGHRRSTHTAPAVDTRTPIPKAPKASVRGGARPSPTALPPKDDGWGPPAPGGAPL